MLYLYSDRFEDYVLCNPSTHMVSNWCSNPAECITTFFRYTKPFPHHTVFTSNKYTLITTYPYDTLADFQANHPELFI